MIQTLRRFWISPPHQQSAAQQPPGDGEVKDNGQNRIDDVAFAGRLDCAQVEQRCRASQAKKEKKKAQKPDRQAKHVSWFHQ